MSFKKLILGLFFICVLANTEGRAQFASKNQQTIVGVAPGAEGREIKLLFIDNYISEQPFKVASSFIDSAGMFSLMYSNTYTREAILRIDYYETTIFLEPQINQYDIVFAPFEYSQNEKMNVLLNPHAIAPLAYAFTFADSGELNQLIGRFNDVYNNFLSKEYKQILLGKGQERTLQFIKETEALFSYSGHAFFNPYMRYQLAMLEDACKLRSKKNLYEMYLKDQSLLYTNPAYQSFAKDFFYQYFNTTTYGSLKEYVNMVNNPAIAVEDVLDSLGRDPWLVNERLREWVFMYALFQTYRSGDIAHTVCASRLEDILAVSKFPVHTQIAKELLRTIKEREEMLFFKDVLWLDEKKNKINFVKDIAQKEKLYYVALISEKYLRCPDCNLEMATLLKIHNKLDKRVEIIVINTDYNFEDYYHHKDRYSPLKYYHFNKDIEWLKQIGAFHLPFFLIVDSRGEVLNFNAPKPSANLPLWFDKGFENK